jgi:hypothetical protein
MAIVAVTAAVIAISINFMNTSIMHKLLDKYISNMLYIKMKDIQSS